MRPARRKTVINLNLYINHICADMLSQIMVYIPQINIIGKDTGENLMTGFYFDLSVFFSDQGDNNQIIFRDMYPVFGFILRRRKLDTACKCGKTIACGFKESGFHFKPILHTYHLIFNILESEE